MVLKIISRSPEETAAIGRTIGRQLSAGDTVALIGELGGGKTLMAAAIAEAAGVGDRSEIHSPTFTIINEYLGGKTIYHCDLYRIDSYDEAVNAGIEDVFDGDGIALIEWADRIPGILPSKRLQITLLHVDGQPATRSIFIEDIGDSLSKIMKMLENSDRIVQND